MHHFVVGKRIFMENNTVYSTVDTSMSRSAWDDEIRFEFESAQYIKKLLFVINQTYGFNINPHSADSSIELPDLHTTQTQSKSKSKKTLFNVGQCK